MAFLKFFAAAAMAGIVAADLGHVATIGFDLRTMIVIVIVIVLTIGTMHMLVCCGVRMIVWGGGLSVGHKMVGSYEERHSTWLVRCRGDSEC
jgi:hypothetical protein